MVLVAPACGDSDLPATDSPATAAEPSAPIRLLTPYGAEDAAHLAEALRGFEASTGIRVELINASGDFVDEVSRAANAADGPDAAIIPQPSLYADLSRQGRIPALPDDLATRSHDQQQSSMSSLTSVDGVPHGVHLRVSPYSLIWYRRDVFEREGWAAPTSAEELDRLTAAIRASGRYAPWCIGAEAGGGTGWLLTDWVEEFLITSGGAEVYDAWADRRIPMNAPEVVAAVQRMADLIRTEGYVAGGPDAVLATPVERSADQLMAAQPACLMHRQADWIVPELGPDAKVGAGGPLDVVPYPTTGGGAPPALLGGDIAAALRDRPEVWSLLAEFADPAFGQSWARAGGYTSPNRGFDESAYPNDWQRTVAAYMKTAPVARFDASDLLPIEIGGGLLWSALVEIVRGAPVEATLTDLESRAAAVAPLKGSP